MAVMQQTPLILQQHMRADPLRMPAETARQLEALLPDLRRVSRRLCQNWGEADDLVQDTLLRVWARISDPTGRPIDELRAFAFATLRHRAMAREDLGPGGATHGPRSPDVPPGTQTPCARPGPEPDAPIATAPAQAGNGRGRLASILRPGRSGRTAG